jgi:hypothetical protein
MIEYALHFLPVVCIVLVFLGVMVSHIWLIWREACERERYWASEPAACPRCLTNYGTNRGQDLCVSRLVDFDETYSSTKSAQDWEPFLGEREFHCSQCGTTAVYERKKGPPILLYNYRPEDVCQPRRCLDCNDVFSLPEYGECPVCGGKHLQLENH